VNTRLLGVGWKDDRCAVVLSVGLGEGRKMPKESPVPEGCPTRAIHPDPILGMPHNFNNSARFVPLLGMVSSLILNCHDVRYFQRLQLFGVLAQHSSLLSMSPGQGVFSLLHGEQPLSSWLVPLGQDRHEVPDGSAEHHLGGGEHCVPIWSIPILEESSVEFCVLKFSAG
jgi:hypothetical protein